ncbi:MAG: CotH kinase family protein [Saprospiraceae bacterium]
MKKYIAIFFICLSGFLQGQKIDHWETAIFAQDTWKYFVGNSEPNTFWRLNTYDDTKWLSGKGGFGYGDGDDSTVIVPCYAVFLRKSFHVTDTSKILSAVLNLDFDDGFVAYINGIEIARYGISGNYPAYNVPALDHESKVYSGGSYDYFQINKALLRKCLMNGDNMLSIQVHNVGIGSSDLSAIPFLSFGFSDKMEYFRSTPPWFVSPLAGNPFISNLPIISITTNGQVIQDNGTKLNALMRVIQNSNGMNEVTDSANIYYGIIGIEIRGSSSSGYPQKSYNVETRDSLDANRNVSLLGLPEENDWALITNYNDKTLMRNTFSYSLYNQLGHYAPRTKYCDVLINDEYQGIYLLSEKIKRDKNRVAISKFDDKATSGNGITGGYIFKNDNKDADELSFTSNYSESGFLGNPEVSFIYVYPKSSELTTSHKTYLPSFINSFESVLYGNNFTNPIDGYARYIDVPSFIDYFILGEVSRSVDAYKKSKFFYKDVDSKGGKIVSGPPWDFDWAYKNIPEGNNQFNCYYGNTDGSGWAYKAYLCNHDPKFAGWTARLMQDPNFVNAIKSRYVFLRKNVLSEHGVNLLVDSLKNIVNEAQPRHFGKWDILGKITIGSPEVDAQPTTYAAAINQFKTWVFTRLAWLDRNMPGILTDFKVVSGDKVKVYPNPSFHQLTIQSGSEMLHAQLYTMQGQLAFKAMLHGNVNTIKHNLPPGMYILKVVLKNQQVNLLKLVVHN